jgi:hypothetical protein
MNRDHQRKEAAQRIVTVLALLLLVACGVADVGTTAATSAKLHAEQAQQGKETLGKVQSDLDAAARNEEQRRRQLDRDAEQ